MLSIALLAEMGMGFIFYLAAFLFVLSIIVFIHELGHFLVARWCGVKVTAFSLGFGPEIYAFIDRQGTRWRIAWIPLGGYVKFMDDENGASVPDHDAIEQMSERERAQSFHAKPLWQRAAIVAAGPAANFLLAIFIFALVFTFIGQRTIEPRVGEVIAASPAERAGFKAGDLIVSIGSNTITSFNDVLRVISANPEHELAVTVNRGGTPVILSVIPELKRLPDGMGGSLRRGVIGIRANGGPDSIEIRKTGFLEGVVRGAQETQFIITTTLTYIGKLFTGQESGDQLGGPIRIAEISGQVAKIGIEPLLQLVAVVSVSVGLINLFPIPLLDGGHLLFYAIEAVRRRPLSARTQEIGFKIGLAIVLTLMVYATWNDRLIFMKWLTGES